MRPRIAWIICIAVLSIHAVVAADERPNFILIIADDVSADDIGCYGHPHIRTPHIDRLAQQGLRCDNAFLTCSSCSPSRCSIITSRYPHQTGAAELHQPLPREQVTLSETLKREGYFTACAGKWHLGNPAKGKFDKVVGGNTSGCEQWVATLRDRPQDKPFFLWLAAFDAHRDYQPGAVDPPHTPKDAVVPPYLPDAPGVRTDLALYYDEVSRLDSYVGKIMDELDRQGVAENTVVMFIADNGRPFPRCKTTLYDSGIKTPCVVRWPAKIKPDQTCASLISSIDIAPTFLDLAGVAIPRSFVGRSFAGLLSDPTKPHRDAIFSEHNWHDYAAHKRAIRTEQYLYIRNWLPQYPCTPPADAVRSLTFEVMKNRLADGNLEREQKQCFVTPMRDEELYDLKVDPHALRDLAGDPKSRLQLLEMRRQLERWRTDTHDEVPETFRPDKYDRMTGKPVGEESE